MKLKFESLRYCSLSYDHSRHSFGLTLSVPLIRPPNATFLIFLIPLYQLYIKQ
jgi:hypothetical protein